jgi:hypothetical protein
MPLCNEFFVHTYLLFSVVLDEFHLTSSFLLKFMLLCNETFFLDSKACEYKVRAIEKLMATPHKSDYERMMTRDFWAMLRSVEWDSGPSTRPKLPETIGSKIQWLQLCIMLQPMTMIDS